MKKPINAFDKFDLIFRIFQCIVLYSFKRLESDLLINQLTFEQIKFDE